MNRKVFFYITAALVIIISGITWIIGNYFIEYALKRGTDTDPKAIPKASRGIITPGLEPPKKPLYKNNIWNIIINNENRTATAFFAKEDSNKWVIIVHGYCRDQRYVWNYAEEYLKRGYNVLTPDLNASGNSEGQYLTMGYKESKDVLAWIKLLDKQFMNAKISLHGVSMGAATVMLVAQEKLPATVYAIIEDCGYTSAYEMFGVQIEKLFGLPQFPAINMINVVYRIKLGCYLSEVTPIRAVENAKLPMLFIHGDDDTLVPVEMVHRLFREAKSDLKEKIIVPGAGHAECIEQDKNYCDYVFSFLAKAEKNR